MAVKKESALAAILPRLKNTDLSPLIGMASGMVPRVLDPFLKSLDKKEKSAVDKIMPPGKGKKIYVHLVDTLTPPIVVELAQPMKISTMPQKDFKQQKIKGIRLTIDDIQLLAKGRTRGNMMKLFWRFKGQMFTMLGILWMFMPLLRLGRSGLREMGNKLTSRWKPLLDLFAQPK
ncbi:hypothetical protein ACFLXV_01350 [Chloroflexota bacterium]